MKGKHHASSSNWLILPAAKADIPNILVLWDVSMAPPSSTASEELLVGLLDRDPHAFLVARANGQLVGTLIVGWDGWRGCFYRLVVHPKWREQGLAAALIEAGSLRLRGLGARRLTAIVSDEDPVATSVWMRAGFEREDGTSRYVRMIDPVRNITVCNSPAKE